MSELNASICEGVARGHCVMLASIDDAQIVYAGPINGAPNAAGRMILLHADDFAKLKTVVDRRKN